MPRAGAPARFSSGYAGSRGGAVRSPDRMRRVVFTAADGLPRVETRGAGCGGQRILSEPFVGADASQLRFDDADGVVDGAAGGGAEREELVGARGVEYRIEIPHRRLGRRLGRCGDDGRDLFVVLRHAFDEGEQLLLVLQSGLQPEPVFFFRSGLERAAQGEAVVHGRALCQFL